MLSLSNVSEEMGLFYFEKDDYYSRENSPAPSEFVGTGAQLLNLEGFSKDTYRNLLKGLSPDGNETLAYIKPRTISNADFDNRCSKFVGRLGNLGLSEPETERFLSIFKDRYSGKALDTPSADSLKSEIKLALKSCDVKGTDRKTLRRELLSMHRYLARSDRRAAYDLTFNAPKSVSLEVLINGNRELLKAHEKAVKYALAEVEQRCIGVLDGPKNNRQFVQTNNLIGATFPHGTSREGDPHLHTHLVTFNLTRRCDGKWRAINNDELYRQSTFIGLVYQNKLAELCQNLGYSIDVYANGTFELKGFTKEQLLEFSKRNTQVREASARLLYEKDFCAFLESKDVSYRYFDRFGTTLFSLQIDGEAARKLGVSVVKIDGKAVISDGFAGRKSFEKQKNRYLRQVTQRLTRAAVLKGRAVKGKMDYVDLAKSWEERARAASLPKLSSRSSQKKKRLGSKLDMNFHESHLGERSAVWSQLEASTQALKQNLGRTTLENLENAVREGKFTVSTDIQPEKRTQSHERLTNLHQLSDEEEVLQIAEAGSGRFDPMVDERQLCGLKEAMGFTDGQDGMVRGVLTSRDQMTVCLGVAGSGKSYAAQSIKKYAEDSGLKVMGLAPDASAAQALQGKSGITSQTIHKYLLQDLKGLTNDRFTKHQVEFSSQLARLGLDRRTLRAITLKIHEQFAEKRLSFASCEDLRRYVAGATTGFSNNQRLKADQAMDRLFRQIGEKQNLIVVDEASKLSTRLMIWLGERVAKNGDRLVLMGDLRQTGAVEAGNPVKNLIDQNKVVVFDLPEPVRQKEGTLMRAVVDSASRSTREGMGQSIENLGDKILTSEKKERRLGLAVKEYMKFVDRGDSDVMLLADLNIDRRSLTDQLRTRLKERGIVEKNDAELKILSDRELTTAQKVHARYYDNGDKVVFHTKVDGIEVGQVYDVQRTSKQKNTVTLKGKNEPLVIAAERLSNATVFREDYIAVAKGDTLRWTRNHAGHINKHLVEVEAVSKRSIMLRDVETGSKTAVKPGDPNFLDYGLVMTVYSSQGHDRKSGIFLAESNVSMNSWYTALSRMKKDVLVITDNKEKLLDRISKSATKQNALEFMHQKEGWLEQRDAIQQEVKKGKALTIDSNDLKIDWLERRNAVQHVVEREKTRAIDGPDLER